MAFACILALMAMRLPAAEGSTRPPITDPAWIWAMPSAEKSYEYPVRLDGRVNFYDPSYKLCWIENHGTSTYVQIAAPLPGLQIGEWVVIEGTVIPARGLEPDRVKVTVLQHHVPIEPLSVKGRINDMNALGSHIVEMEGYVDGEQLIDAQHLRLALIVDNRPVIGWVKPEPGEAPDKYAGHFVRAVGLYSPRLDPTATQTTIELWIVSPRDIELLGGIEDSPAFDLPLVPIDQFYKIPLNTHVRIKGIVVDHDPGSTMTIRDGTGEVQIRSIQRQRLAPGSPVEAIGRVASSGPRLVLLGALYRRAAAAPAASTGNELTTIAQIRELSAEEAAKGKAVKIAGVVTWSLPEADFFFLQDVSGGVRVHFQRDQMPAPALLKYLRIVGRTSRGAFAPTVELERYDDLGTMSPPDARPITFDEAITGREDGQWVQIRGFLDRVVSDHDWRWIHVTTPSGDFVAHIQTPVLFVANPGSLISVRGVCETAAGADGRITGITLRVAFLHDITLEEDAPVDPFDLPLRTIKAVTELSGGPNLLRVRIAGTVIQSVPGQYAFAEEKDAGMLLLSHDPQALVPGDRIEAVGILGREGVRAVLREARFRRVGHGAAPAAVELTDPARPEVALDSRLARIRATVIDAFHAPDHLRLTLQAGKTIFEAVLDSPPAGAKFAAGEVLDVTGIYRLTFDDSRQWRGFRLQLRSPDDIAVVTPARFWTAERAMIACAILGGLGLMAVAWITALRRRVRQQTGQIREQLERQSRLEAEVQRAARLESLGTLAGGIAHDFNNLLTVVLGNVTIAMAEADVMRHAGDYLREIERGARRARELTQQLLTFARGGHPLRINIALHEIVRQATSLVLHGTSVRCEYDIPGELWDAHADKDQISQALQNLTLNAVQAMPHGGTLHVSLRNEELDAGAKPGLAPGRYVKLTMTDTGTGIRPEILSRIFDPYFTTKKDSPGLGLAMVFSIVRKHQGWIEAESTPDSGATFTIWLPVSDLPVQAPAPPIAVVPPPPPAPRPEAAKTPPAVPAAPRTETPSAAPTPSLRVSTAAPFGPPRPATKHKPRVLLMDDEESICRVVSIVLQRLGCEPVIVSDGDAALREFKGAREAGRPIELLILDLTIPGGMGGREVIEAVRQIDPLVPAIVSSGYSNDPVLAHYAECGFQAMVQKPYDVRQFATVINEFVGRARESAPVA